MILLLEISLVFLLIRKKGFVSPYVIIFLISFIYLKAVYIDFLLFGIIPTLNITIPIIPSFDGQTYLLYDFLCFSYFFSFFITAYFFHDNKILNNGHLVTTNTFLSSGYNFIFILLIIYNIYCAMDGIDLTRVERGNSQTPFMLIMRNSINYFFIFIFSAQFKTKNLFRALFIITSIIYLLLSYEREPLVIFFLCGIYKYKLYLKPTLLILVSVCLLLILNIWKLFYTSVLYSDGNGFAYFTQYVNNDHYFSLAGLDPKISFLLFYNYLDNMNLYSDYYFSYITGVINQFHRFLFYSEYKTLAEYSSEKFTAGNFGTAFSFMLESMLNFWYLGPSIIAVVLCYFVKKSIFLIQKYGIGVVVILIFITMKFMRTELATLLKLQVFPLLISMIIFKSMVKKFLYK